MNTRYLRRFISSFIIVFLLVFLLSPAWGTNVTATTTEQRKLGIWGDWKVTWTAITTTANTCIPYTSADKFSGATVQVLGTWGGATVTLWGSNDGGTTWFALTSLQTSAAMSFTANGHGTVLSTPVQQIKWVLAGGDGTTSLSVIVKGQR